MSLLSNELNWIDKNKHKYEGELHAASVKENIKKRYRIAELEAAINSITSDENIHPIKDWAICGIYSNSTRGSEGRESRLAVYNKFTVLVNNAKQLLKQDK